MQKIQADEEFHINEVIDIPSKGKSIDEYERPSFEELKPASELRSVFRRCHNYVHGNQGIQKDKAFYEFLKVIFAKVAHEKESAEVRFFVTNNEIKSKIGQMKCSVRLEDLFEEVKNKYQHIFQKSEIIDLKPNVLAYIVSQMQRFSLLHTDTDIKGEAYEEIVGANLRGDRGEFFTPRNVCNLAIKSLLAMFKQERWTKLKIIDPACGTGGFLIAIINHMRHFLFQEELNKWKDVEKALVYAESRLRDFCSKNLFGIDINPLLGRACQMNEVMHGNGSVNLFSTNSLLSPGEWPDQVRSEVSLHSFDLVFSNPPFGSKIPIDDPHILHNYDLGHIWDGLKMTDKLRASAPPEELFIERCVKFLRPGGKLAIVLPDSILSNPGKVFIRHWILKHSQVLASIDMPRETFLPFVGTKTSLLLVKRRSKGEMDIKMAGGELPHYNMFMAMVERIGQDRRGSPMYKMSSDGKHITVENERQIIRIINGKKHMETHKVHEPIRDDDLIDTTNTLSEWIKEQKGVID